MIPLIPLLALALPQDSSGPGLLDPPVEWIDLAGVPTEGNPGFTRVQAFNEGDPIRIGIDVFRHPELVGVDIDVYLWPHRTPGEWAQDRTLHHVGGIPPTIRPAAAPFPANVWELDPGTLSGLTGTTDVGVGYDVVLDVDRNGVLSLGDGIDGGKQPGLFVMYDLVKRGPYQPRQSNFNGGRFRKHQTFYPEGIESLGELPLVVISHGNGHQYTWYGHIGRFLASWGFIVTSHENNTGPGIATASTSTLVNTNLFFSRLADIADGRLVGHVDRHTIVWMGHSRGGEGVVRAYKRLFENPGLGSEFTIDDIRLVSSIAPTDFLGTGVTDPLDVPYHLWTGAADADVNGCAESDIAQPFHLHDRARGERMSIALYGAGHADFHDGGGSSVATGPCRIGRPNTHRIMKGYLLPLLKHVLERDVACREYLYRQYETFRPPSAPDNSCVVVNLMYRPDPEQPRFVLDDFETNPELERSSSGGQVAESVLYREEGRLDDGNQSFSAGPADRFNGMTLASASDETHGTVFSFDGLDPSYLVFEVPRSGRDLRRYDTLSFRACQATRHPLTRDELGDLTFTVELVDRAMRTSSIRIDAYGGGLEEPYLRGGCGRGNGWNSEWETIRIPLEDFRTNGNPIDLSRIVALAFRFGPGQGSEVGRIGLDEIEFVRARNH